MVINYLTEGESQLKIRAVISGANKQDTLVNILCMLGDQPGIIFCNFKDTISEVSDFLLNKNIDHGCFFGGMEQKDREKALIKFRNGTHRLLLATDLAARGIDIPEIRFIIHFQLPNKEHEFTHRNGRTARMNRDGTAYLLKVKNEPLPE
jgi:superfamily II DNA/RNA helicase